MAMAATRKSATAAISLIKATAAVKFPHIRSSNLETPNVIGSIRSMSQIYSREHCSAPYGFNPIHNSVWPPAGTRSATKVSSPLSTQKVRLFHGAPKEVMNMAEKRNISDYKRRLLAQKYEMRRKLYKAFCSDPSLPMDLREKCRVKLSKLPRNSSFTRIRNRCIFTGRPRSVYRVFRTSRIVFRDLASKGELMGVKKASW